MKLAKRVVKSAARSLSLHSPPYSYSSMNDPFEMLNFDKNRARPVQHELSETRQQTGVLCGRPPKVTRRRAQAHRAR